MIRPVLQVWSWGGAGRVWPMCSVTRCQVRGRTSHLDTEESRCGVSTLHYTVHSSVSTSIYSVYCTPLRNGPAITSHRVTIRDSPHQHAGSRDKIHRLLTQKNFRRINYPPLAPAPPLRGGGEEMRCKVPSLPHPMVQTSPRPRSELPESDNKETLVVRLVTLCPGSGAADTPGKC